MTDRRVLQQAIVSAGVAAFVVALAAACGTFTTAEPELRECGDGSATNALVYAGIFSDVAEDYSFDPYQVEITVGQSVCWEISEGVSHTITPIGGGTAFGGTIDANQPFLVDTFSVAGDYPYYCQVHTAQGMTGLVRVLP